MLRVLCIVIGGAREPLFGVFWGTFLRGAREPPRTTAYYARGGGGTTIHHATKRCRTRNPRLKAGPAVAFRILLALWSLALQSHYGQTSDPPKRICMHPSELSSVTNPTVVAGRLSSWVFFSLFSSAPDFFLHQQPTEMSMGKADPAAILRLFCCHKTNKVYFGAMRPIFVCNGGGLLICDMCVQLSALFTCKEAWTMDFPGPSRTSSIPPSNFVSESAHPHFVPDPLPQSFCAIWTALNLDPESCLVYPAVRISSSSG